MPQLQVPGSATLKNQSDKFWKRRVLNPGLLGEMREHYLCAMFGRCKNIKMQYLRRLNYSVGFMLELSING